MTELSKWGRWGKDDQLGALNLITIEKRRQAMALARTGTVVSLERPVALSPKPEERTTGRTASPFLEMPFSPTTRSPVRLRLGQTAGSISQSYRG